MKGFCEKCNKWQQGAVSKKSEDYQVYDDTVNVCADVLICPSCGSEMYCEELDNSTLNKAYSAYRQKHFLLSPDDIKNIRDKYKLSQRALSRLLNWGDKTIYRYEQGSLQDKSHNSLLFYINNPLNLKEYLSKNETKLNDKELEKLKSTLGEIIKRMTQTYTIDYCNHVNKLLPFEFDNIKFSYEKFSNTVLMFANLFVRNARHLQKVVLMKILFYSDMYNTKLYGFPITGLPYMHMQYGPVPYNYELLLEWLYNDKLAFVKTKYKDQYTYHEIVPTSGVDIQVFNHEEIKVIEKIYSAFKDFGSKEIAEYSHKEKAYKETKPGECISYAFAKDIELPD